MCVEQNKLSDISGGVRMKLFKVRGLKRKVDSDAGLPTPSCSYAGPTMPGLTVPLFGGHFLL